MLKFFGIVLASTFLLSSAFAAQKTRPIESLHDLPAKWEGVAGGLLTKVPATFSIDKVRKVSRDEDGSPDSFSALYDVDAALSLGERHVAVTQVRMTRYSNNGIYELTLFTNDELAQNLLAIVAYDETSDTYSLRELPRNGERRFVFSAAARR